MHTTNINEIGRTALIKSGIDFVKSFLLITRHIIGNPKHTRKNKTKTAMFFADTPMENDAINIETHIPNILIGRYGSVNVLILTDNMYIQREYANSIMKKTSHRISFLSKTLAKTNSIGIDAITVTH